MLNIAARRHDARLIGRQHLRDGKLSWRPHKTLRTTGKLLTIRVLPRLQEAHDGCTAPEIMAVSGHATLAQVQVYIEEVEQERMAEAAMVKRSAADQTGNASG